MAIKLRAYFLFRKINDLDYSLPLVVTFENPIIFLEKQIKNDIRMEIIRSSSSRLINIKPGGINLKIVKFLAHRVPKQFNVTVMKNLSELELSKKKELVISELNLHEDIDILFADHYFSEARLSLLREIKKIFPNIYIICVPHGANNFKNRMTDLHLVCPPRNINVPDYIDLLVCNDAQHFYQFDHHNKKIIPSMRYTKEWSSYLVGFSESIKKLTYQKKNILLLHSKSDGNISFSEMDRLIKMVVQFDGLHLTIKPHPGGIEEVRRLAIPFKAKVSIVDGEISRHINQADVVFFIQTSAVFECFIQGKPVLWLRYITSNILTEECQHSVNIAECPDDAFNIIRKIADGVYPYGLKLPIWKAPSLSTIEATWNKTIMLGKI